MSWVNVSAAGYCTTSVIQSACCWGYGHSVPVAVEWLSDCTHVLNSGASIGIITIL